jgi:8-oxo-dGTP diphosphatase
VDEHGYVVNVDAAVVRNGEYLLIERGSQEEHGAGLLAFPGGKLEATPGNRGVLRATARREVREETGVEIRRVRVVDSSVFALDDGRRVVNVVTTADYADGKAHRVAPDEVAAVEWRTPDAIRDGDDSPDFLIEYLNAVAAARDG